MDELANKLLGVFHKGFNDYKNKVKELFPEINTTFLISSMAIPVVEEVIQVHDNNNAPTETLPPTTLEAISIVEALEAPEDALLEAPTD